MRRAINVNIMGQRAYVLGGDKAGRFWSNNTKTQPRRKNAGKWHRRGLEMYNKAKVIFCLTVFAATWYMCWASNQAPSAQTPQAEASEDLTITNLTKEQGFEQVAPRDTVERERAETTEQLIERYFGKDAKTALAIAKAESGLNPTALGDTNTKYPSAGVFQIRLLPERGITKEQMFDIEHNVEYAKMLYDKYGWSCWSVFNNGSFKKFL